jgi:hypothetical protein
MGSWIVSWLTDLWEPTVYFFLSLFFSLAQAADDPSIGQPLRGEVQAVMGAHISARTVGGVYRHYDAVTGELMALTLQELHAGIVEKSGFYVSCADFVTPGGEVVDLDFLVLPSGEGLVVSQGLVHKRDGVKRPYDFEQ